MGLFDMSVTAEKEVNNPKRNAKKRKSMGL